MLSEDAKNSRLCGHGGADFHAVDAFIEAIMVSVIGSRQKKKSCGPNPPGTESRSLSPESKNPRTVSLGHNPPYDKITYTQDDLRVLSTDP